MATLVVDGTLRDLPYVEALRLRESDALGWLPLQEYAAVLAGQIRSRRIVLTRDDGEPTGYCLASAAPPTARIVQIVVQEDARRWHRALRLLAAVEAWARARGCLRVWARVAADLEANAFWRAAGYTPIATVRSTHHNRGPSRAQRLLLLYERPLQPTLWAAGLGDALDDDGVPRVDSLRGAP